MLSAKGLVERLNNDAGAEIENKLAILPTPNLELLEGSGAASVDLRLGRWFRALRPSRTSLLRVSGNAPKESYDTSSTKDYFVAFGDKFVLHPQNFILGITLEWLRVPADLGGYVTGKSSLGRRGLIIETASGIQPGFTGCLALELSNVGEVPIALEPGMLVCQVFLHEVSPPCSSTRSQFSGRRKPVLGQIRSDLVLEKLSNTDDL